MYVYIYIHAYICIHIEVDMSSHVWRMVKIGPERHELLTSSGPLRLRSVGGKEIMVEKLEVARGLSGCKKDISVSLGTLG